MYHIRCVANKSVQAKCLVDVVAALTPIFPYLHSHLTLPPPIQSLLLHRLHPVTPHPCAQLTLQSAVSRWALINTCPQPAPPPHAAIACPADAAPPLPHCYTTPLPADFSHPAAFASTVRFRHQSVCGPSCRHDSGSAADTESAGRQQRVGDRCVGQFEAEAE